MTRRFLIKFSIFLALGGLLYFLFFSVSLRASRTYKNGAAIICEKKREWARNAVSFQPAQAPVLFMGNSVMLSGLQPLVFDEELSGRVQSFNFALPALTIGPSYFVLKDIIRRTGPPRYIVMPVIIDGGTEESFFDYYAIQGMGFPGEFLSYLVNRKNKRVIYNYLTPMKLYTHETFKFMFNAVFRPSDIRASDQKNAGITNLMIQNKGYYFIREEAIFPDGKLPPGYGIDPKADLSPQKPRPFHFEQDPYVKKFFDLTQENHIKVLLIDFIYREKTQRPYSQMPEMYKLLMSKYPNVVVTKNSWKHRFLPNRYFSDRGHLNPEGAKLFTRWISQDFAEAFGHDMGWIHRSVHLHENKNTSQKRHEETGAKSPLGSTPGGIL